VLLEVQGLRIGYDTGRGKLEVVAGVDLKVGREEILGLVGESGSGKTTLALAVLRILPEWGTVLGGRILFDGLDLLRMSEEEMRRIRGRRISMVFQDPYSSLNPTSRIRDHFLELYRAHYGHVDEKEVLEKAGTLLRIVGVPEEKLHDYPHQLSGGQRQRVAIALAIALKPELVILDEPTSSLDVLVEAQLMELFKDLRKRERISMVFITHNLGILSELADRIAVMYAGKIVEVSPTEKLFADPLHPYTRALIDSVPTIGSDELRTISGEPPDLRNPPKGCRFHPRCPFAMDVCRVAEPVMKDVGGREVACHLY
jgi:oligopeptide/dipeptide ABC transporter, ATP-binding protein, C-terminal domain